MKITQPRWKMPEYTISQINRAGEILRNKASTFEQIGEALDIVDNWRSAHAYPLHVFYMNMRRNCSAGKEILIAQRLKRIDSIIYKLVSGEGTRLSKMQDIGGCRMVLPSIEEVYYHSQRFQKSRIRHEYIKTYDYIQSPKPSGYRSVHLVYKFKTDSPQKAKYNDYPMLIELQFRTHLQHIWATALETIGLFTNQALKAGRGDKGILRFFVVISSLFAIKEGCPICPNTTRDEKELISEIEILNDQHHVLDMLKAIRTIIDYDGENVPDKKGYYILQLNYETQTLRRWFFKPSELENATRFYDALEKNKNDRPLDIVLIRANSYSMVKAAYPNYFLDIGEFIQLVKSYLA